MQENNELPTYSPEDVAQLIAMTEDLQTENEQQREELRKLHRQQQIALSDNQRLSAELQAAIQDLKDLKAETEELRSDLRQAEQTNRQIQRQLSEQQTLSSQVQKLTQQLSEKQKQLQMLEARAAEQMQQAEVLKQEQAQRMQAEQRARSEAEKNKTLQNLLDELSRTSDSELPTKLNAQLKEKDRQLLNEQEQKKQLEKKLSTTIAAASADKQARDKQISLLRTELQAQKFDKEKYLRGLESRERALRNGQAALRSDREAFDTRVQNKAQEIEKDVIADYEAKKRSCEAERSRLIAQQKAEKDTIDAAVAKKVKEHTDKLDEQAAKERAEQDKKHESREKELEKNWKSRNTALTAKYTSIIGLTFSVCLISGIVAMICFVIAFVHGLLPFIITDGKEIGSWISSDWHAIFQQSFTLKRAIVPILQLFLPVIFLIAVGIWTALDFEERKWVLFADKVSIIVIGSGIGISFVFGKQLSAIGLNTVMLPIAVYLLYVLARWLFETGAIDGLANLVNRLTDWWHDLEPNEKQGNVLLAAIFIIAAIMVYRWIT